MIPTNQVVMAENEMLRNKCERLQSKLRAIIQILEPAKTDDEVNGIPKMGGMLFCPECDSYCECVDGTCRRCGRIVLVEE